MVEAMYSSFSRLAKGADIEAHLATHYAPEGARLIEARVTARGTRKGVPRWR